MNKEPFKFELGDELKDTLTGFKGTVTYRVDYLTGCNQYGLQPPMDKDKNVPDPKQFDEHRLESTGKSHTLPGQKDVKKNPGGPGISVKRTGAVQKTGRIK